MDLGKYFKELNSINKRLADQFSPILNYANEVNNQIRPFLEAQQKTQATLSNIFKAIEPPGVFIQNMEAFYKINADIRERLNNLISPAFVNLTKSFEQLPEKTKKSLIALGQKGWFLDLEMPSSLPQEFQTALEEDDVQEAEEALVTYFESRINDIEASLKTSFPHRAKIISSALKAHRKKAFELSVPVFLSQADGICYELTRQHFFMNGKNTKKPQTAEYVESLVAEAYQKALLAPLAHTLPISASVKQRGDNFDGLNRHMVLHGESLDYGTHLNSCRALSLLNYVAQILTKDRAKPEK